MSRGGRGGRGWSAQQNNGRPEVDVNLAISYSELPLFPVKKIKIK